MQVDWLNKFVSNMWPYIDKVHFMFQFKMIKMCFTVFDEFFFSMFELILVAGSMRFNKEHGESYISRVHWQVLYQVYRF